MGGEKNCESGGPRSKSFYFPCDDDAPLADPGAVPNDRWGEAKDEVVVCAGLRFEISYFANGGLA